MTDLKKYLRIFLIAVVLIYIVATQIDLSEENGITIDQIESSSSISGLDFQAAEMDSMVESLNENLESYLAIRDLEIPNQVPPSLNFNPIPVGFHKDKNQKPLQLSKTDKIQRPKEDKELAFYSVRELGILLKSRQISSVELTKFFIERLKTHGPTLECVIVITEERAIEAAKKADEEIAKGKYRGPLHGIPFGAKDLLSAKGYKTTWGAVPYRDQILDTDATVIKKLEEAGAVLIAKLTLGALAWGDVWYGGKTRNPWNLEQGSSGSSAGSAAATAAGLVPFAIGTETWGSIVSPSTRCGTTGLRPTFGMVSKAGTMALSWSMDKIGPICRTTEDCAIVFHAMFGPDGLDQSVFDYPFNYSPNINPQKVKIGYLKELFEEDYPNKVNDKASLDKLAELGFNLVPIELPTLPVEALSFILSAEAAAAFDDLTRSNRDDGLVRQIKNAWPNVFRASRFIPAVEYIQANRVRYVVIQQMAEIFKEVDLYVAPSFGGNNLLLTNLTGHPCVVLPNGFNDKGSPTSISFIGNLFDEGQLLSISKFYQDATDFHKKHPSDFQ